MQAGRITRAMFMRSYWGFQHCLRWLLLTLFHLQFCVSLSLRRKVWRSIHVQGSLCAC